MWSSAAVAHLLQVTTCCAFIDGIQHTLVVTSGYLSYCCLSIISNQSAHSPLTSDINKTISSLSCDWLISNLCYQAIEQVYLIKWPVSVYIYIYIYTGASQ